MRFCGEQRREALLLATKLHVCSCDIAGLEAGESYEM